MEIRPLGASFLLKLDDVLLAPQDRLPFCLVNLSKENLGPLGSSYPIEMRPQSTIYMLHMGLDSLKILPLDPLGMTVDIGRFSSNEAAESDSHLIRRPDR